MPSWGDRHDILSLLRACNYDPDECISIYLHLEKDGRCLQFAQSFKVLVAIHFFSSSEPKTQGELL